MNKLFTIFILTVILFSCKTSYDKNFTMQCNQNNVKEDIETINSEKQKYIDSVYSSVIEINSINEYTSFLKIFPESHHNKEIKNKRQKLFLIRKKVIESQLNLDDLIKINPCYIPIYKNIDYVRDTNIQFESLFNSELDSTNPYRNRYLVGDFNTADKNGKSKGIQEKFFNIKEGWEFKELFLFAERHNIQEDSLLTITNEYLKKYLEEDLKRKKISIQLRMYKNYYLQVAKFIEEETKKKYSTFRGYKYTGQNLCFCEITNDTILLISKHVTSARGKSRSSKIDSTTGEKTYSYFESLPTGKYRKYYASHNRITIRNWETQRKYSNDDKIRDSMTGGGNSRVTYFDGKTQLPNFLLIDPDPLYRGAMHRNGIHEGSLTNMSRCMLGTPQSLGCLRTTDYGSKFCRWWIPKYANLFIYYEEKRYSNKQLSEQEIDGIKLPFKNDKEGNLFRKWVNINYPNYAKEIDLEERGSCSNCFMQLAWEKYYNEYLETKEGKKLDFTLPQIISNNKKEEVKIIEEKIVTKTEEVDLTQFDIIEEYYIIIGCFNEIKNAKSYSEKIKRKGYTTYVFYNNNSKCNFVSIGPYQDKQKSLSDLPSIQKDIDEESWIFTKIVK